MFTAADTAVVTFVLQGLLVHERNTKQVAQTPNPHIPSVDRVFFSVLF